MAYSKDGRGWSDTPRTSDLAAVCRCEREYVLSRQHGEQRVAHRQARAVVGEAEHDQFHQATTTHHNAGIAQARRDQEATASPRRDRRCFIASYIYGVDHEHTEQLRAWRDRVLMKSFAGRVVVRTYYGLAPSIVDLLCSTPWLVPIVRSVINAIRVCVHPTSEQKTYNVIGVKHIDASQCDPVRCRRAA